MTKTLHFMAVLTIALFIVKLFGLVEVPWLAVFLPAMLMAVFITVVLAVLVAAVMILVAGTEDV